MLWLQRASLHSIKSKATAITCTALPQRGHKFYETHLKSIYRTVKGGCCAGGLPAWLCTQNQRIDPCLALAEDSHAVQAEVEDGYPVAVEESYSPTKAEEVTQLLTRLASTGTAACCLDEAFGGDALPAAMESKPQEWRDQLEEGEAAPCAQVFLLKKHCTTSSWP